MTARRARLLLVVLATSAVAVAGCGAEGSSAPAAGATGTSPSTLDGSITVSAAASLAGAFGELGEDFTAAHPGVEVTFNFDASSSLAAQLLEGAPADVFASADRATMASVVDAGLAEGEPRTFARNRLVIVTRTGNPERIGSLDDLAGLADVGVVSLCAEAVPCGRYAAEALERAGVELDESAVSRGRNAGATLTAVAEGDAVAGITYATDARSAPGRVEAVPIPDDLDVTASYPIAALKESGEPRVAAAFVEHVLSPEGRDVLSRHGFLPPW